MVERLSEHIVQWLIKNEVIFEEERELYEYATFNRIFTVLPFLMIVPFCLMTNTMINGIVVCVTFLALRRYAGGYHAKTPMKCWAYSSLLMTVLIYGTTIIENNSIILTFVSIAVCSICFFSPIDSENRRLDVSEKKRYRKYSRCISLMFLGFYIMFSVLSENALAIMIAMGIMFSGALQLVGAMEQYSHVKKKNDKNVGKMSFRA